MTFDDVYISKEDYMFLTSLQDQQMIEFFLDVIDFGYENTIENYFRSHFEEDEDLLYNDEVEMFNDDPSFNKGFYIEPEVDINIPNEIGGNNSDEPPISQVEYESGKDVLCVTTTKHRLYLNSTRPKLIKNYIKMIFNSGIILKRCIMKKEEYDIYKYYRAYDIVGQYNSISLN